MGLFKSIFGGLFQESRLKVKTKLTPEEEAYRRSALIEYIRLTKATHRLRNIGQDCTALYSNGYVDRNFFNTVMLETMRTAQKIIPKIGTLKSKLLHLGVPKELLERISNGQFNSIAKNLNALGVPMDLVKKL
ncbi:MAG: hypothetical protein ACP6IU_01165 [Candidatus Asgardarchaeia archaeon]